jgi:hypothetical protein
MSGSLGGMTPQAGFGLRVGQVLDILGASRLMAEGAAELVRPMSEPKVRRPLFGFLPLDQGCRGAIVASGANGRIGIGFRWIFPGDSSVTSAAIREEDRVPLVGEAGLGLKGAGPEKDSGDQNQDCPGNLVHDPPLPAKPGSEPMGISTERWARA